MINKTTPSLFFFHFFYFFYFHLWLNSRCLAFQRTARKVQSRGRVRYTLFRDVHFRKDMLNMAFTVSC